VNFLKHFKTSGELKNGKPQDHTMQSLSPQNWSLGNNDLSDLVMFFRGSLQFGPPTSVGLSVHDGDCARLSIFPKRSGLGIHFADFFKADLWTLAMPILNSALLGSKHGNKKGIPCREQPRLYAYYT
jgi:hypothetical protein